MDVSANSTWKLGEAEEEKTRATNLKKAKLLPDPVGFKMLVMPVKVQNETDSGIVLPDEAVERENIATIVAFVMKQGPDCYNDTKRFPSGSWCNEGDFIVMSPYTGTRIDVNGSELRLINDDSISAVVEDPRGIVRAG